MYYLIAAILFIVAISWTVIQSSSCSKASSYQSKSDSTSTYINRYNMKAVKQSKQMQIQINKEELNQIRTKKTLSPQDDLIRTIQISQTCMMII